MPFAMDVIALTLLCSLALVGLFVFLFLGERRQQRFRSAESEALRPLEEDANRPPPSSSNV